MWRDTTGDLGEPDSLIEVFRNAAPHVEIRNCQSKLSFLETELIGRAAR